MVDAGPDIETAAFRAVTGRPAISPTQSTFGNIFISFFGLMPSRYDCPGAPCVIQNSVLLEFPCENFLTALQNKLGIFEFLIAKQFKSPYDATTYKS